VGADAGEDGDRGVGYCAVGIEADDARGGGTDNVADFLRDGGEHLGRWHPAGDQRGDPA
jgi:hypothetical protein